MTLKIMIHKAEEDGYWVEVPYLPGCVSKGESIEKLRENMREAVVGWLKVKFISKYFI